MKRLLVTLLLVGTILPVAIPASAAKPERIGEQISIFSSGSWSFDAEAPFYIAHGWSIDPTAGYPIRRFSFELEVNDVPVEADFVDTEYTRGEDEPLARRSVHNFPSGKTGSVEFTGHWFAPCQYAVDYGEIPPRSCPDRFEIVEARRTVVLVTFEP